MQELLGRYFPERGDASIEGEYAKLVVWKHGRQQIPAGIMRLKDEEMRLCTVYVCLPGVFKMFRVTEGSRGLLSVPERGGGAVVTVCNVHTLNCGESAHNGSLVVLIVYGPYTEGVY